MGISGQTTVYGPEIELAGNRLGTTDFQLNMLQINGLHDNTQQK